MRTVNVPKGKTIPKTPCSGWSIRPNEPVIDLVSKAMLGGELLVYHRGEVNVDRLEYHKPDQCDTLHYATVFFTNGTRRMIFDPDMIDYLFEEEGE